MAIFALLYKYIIKYQIIWPYCLQVDHRLLMICMRMNTITHNYTYIFDQIFNWCTGKV